VNLEVLSMNQMVRGRVLRALLALPLLLLPALGRASGFALESQGARAMGFSGAYVAQAADPSAIYYNAAGIGFLKGKHVYVGALFGGVSTDFTGEGPYPAAGTLESSDRGLGLLPTIYYSQQVGERLYVGVGFNRPFGFKSSWDNPDQFTGRYICVECELGAWGLNPTVAWRVEDRFAIGAGLDLRFASFKTVRRLQASPDPFPVPTDVAQYTLDGGTDTGVGFNLGLLASPTEDFSIGLSYRHKVTAEHDAQAGFVQIRTGNATVDDAVAIALPANQLATVAFTYPAIVAAGAALRRGYWTFEADVQWTLWSSLDQVTIEFPSTPALDSVSPQDYESTWRGAIGVEYLVGDDWEVRGGYSYDRSPQPTDTISPFLHDEDRHGFALGGSYKYESLRLDAVARYLLYSNRSTQGTSRYDYNGLYQSDGFSLAVSFGYRF
jgi:long-chain fatty acid transport protein